MISGSRFPALESASLGRAGKRPYRPGEYLVGGVELLLEWPEESVILLAPLSLFIVRIIILVPVLD